MTRGLRCLHKLLVSHIPPACYKDTGLFYHQSIKHLCISSRWGRQLIVPDSSYCTDSGNHNTNEQSSTKLNDTDSDMDLTKFVKVLHRVASPSLAGGWDNVGLLVEPSPPHTVNTVLLTNDLTPPVLAEAVALKTDLILSYHPPIFSPLKRLTQTKWKEQLIVKCIENRIAVFSPHTSYDCVEGGVNDWLIGCFDTEEVKAVEQHEEQFSSFSKKVTLYTAPSQKAAVQEKLSAIPGVKLRSSDQDVSEGSPGELRCVCLPTALRDVVKLTQTLGQAIQDIEVTDLTKVPKLGYGMGRKAALKQSLSVDDAVRIAKKHLGLSHVRLASPPDSPTISSVAVCAGSGSSVLRNVKADLYVTGEMSHHDVLHAVYNGTSVILCEHSNTERGYLSVLRERLQELTSNKVTVHVSSVDKDPLVIV